MDYGGFRTSFSTPARCGGFRGSAVIPPTPFGVRTAPRRAPGSSQEAPRRFQEGPKRLQEAPKRSLRSPQEVSPRGFKRPQEAPKRPQEAPKRVQEGSRGAQEQSGRYWVLIPKKNTEKFEKFAQFAKV